ncbi:LPS assembly protein LptD [bacterium]|nr:LPS assembly protein LptD [bacterium]
MNKIAWLFLFIISIPLWGDEIILDHADRLRTSLKGEEVVYLDGNVKVRYKSDTLTSSHAIWNKDQDQVQFIQDVWIYGERFKLSTKWLKYDKRLEYAQAIGEVQLFLNRGNTRVSGKEGEYWGREKKMIMKKEPALVSVDSADSGRIHVSAQKMLYYMEEDKGVAVGNVQARMFEQGDSLNPLIIYCDSMEFFTRSDLVIAYNNVKIIKDTTSAFCHYAEYQESLQVIYLSDRPIIEDPNSRIKGDNITVYLEEGQISKVNVQGNPEGFYHPPEDSLGILPDSKFESDSMVFYFEEGQIVRGALYRRARSKYYPFSPDTLKREWNEVSGDSILIWFKEGQMDSIEISGGTIGAYFTEQYKRDQNTISDTIEYMGEIIQFSIPNKIVRIIDRAKVKYNKMGLTSYIIIYNIEENIIKATPEPDYQELPDSLVNYPVLSDNEGTIKGIELYYNTQSKRGKIITASTSYKRGYYNGKVIKKSDDNVFYGRNIDYTTCEYTHDPHYHFASSRFKMITRDKIIARSIVLYIMELPVFAIPFYVFSIKPDRHSGILPFKVGRFQRGDRFVKDIGYYYAPSDYWDIGASFDYDENAGWLFKSDFKYALRYKFSGYLRGSYKWKQVKGWEEVEEKNHWDFRLSHNQDISPTLKIRGSGTFVSDASFLQESKDLPQERMERTLSSNLTLTKSWKNSVLSATLSRQENLETGIRTEYLPTLKYNLYSRSIIPRDIGEKEKWFHLFQYSYGATAINYLKHSPDVKENRKALDNQASFSFPYDLGPYLTLTPRLNLKATLYDEDKEGHKFPLRTICDAQINAKTIMYGNFPIRIGKMDGIRHVFSPSAGFSWRPKFKDMDRFYSVGGVGGSAAEDRRLNFSVSNIFQLKIKEGAQTKKINLFNASTSGSYNFLSEEQPLSDLKTSLRTQPFSFWNINISMTHSFYPEGSDQIELVPNLKNISVNSDLSFQQMLNWREDNSLEKKSHRWDTRISHYFSKTISSDINLQSHWLKFKTTFEITSNWKIDYDLYFDIEAFEKVSEQIVIYRDMHCFEGRFVWVPMGYENGYYFKINVKEHKEVKIEGGHGRLRSFF